MKPALLFHVQHFLGMGHLIRAFALAEALDSRFRVIVASGGRFPTGIEAPANVEVVALPALGLDEDRMLISHEPSLTVKAVLRKRAKVLADLHEELMPDVVLVELFPFGRKKLAGELEPLLERARNRQSPALVATSVRDILVTGRHDQQRHDDRAADAVDRLVDLVIVHGDERFVSLEDSFRPIHPISKPILYSGFVAPSLEPSPSPTGIAPGTIVASAGGGWVGGALMRASIEASTILHRRHGVATTLITGPLLDDNEARRLETLAKGRPVTIVRSVPGLLPTLCEAKASISQAGYNTMMDLLRARIPAVVVPFGDDRENEQPRRATRLRSHGIATVVDPKLLSPTVLADAVTESLDTPVGTMNWDLSGARRTTQILVDELSSRTVGAR